MKRLLLFSLILAFVMSGYTQNRVTVSKELRNQAVKMVKATTETMNFTNEALPANKFWPPEEGDVGNTYYDNQSNSSIQTRVVAYDDGTAGAVWTFGLAFTAFADRGTGYNYFDGNTWGAAPTVRLEEQRTGWPAYAAFGENGEINCAHYSGTASGVGGLAISKRDTKGSGDWSLVELHSPESAAELLWPRIATGGVDHSVIHAIALTMPVANGGIVYQGLDGALLYSRSTDGGATWDPENLLMEEVSSNYYNSFSGDTYEVIAEGDNVAILYGESWCDLALLKSTDGGNTFNQTIIWQNPYPFWVTGTPTDTFYCADGDHHLAFDQSGMVHVVFGINRAYADAAGSYWFPLVGGIGYWNENRPTFSSGMDALNPYGDPGTELVEDYSLIGWEQDINNNGTWDILGEGGLYYVGSSSMPQIVIDDQNQIFMIFTSITETYNNGIQDYRHMWCRTSPNGDFWGKFTDLTSDLVHIFDECVWPSVSITSDDNFYLVYQCDQEPGGAVRGDLDPYAENIMKFMKVNKADVWTGIKDNNMAINDYDVLQNYPNPATGITTVKVNVRNTTDMTLEVVSMLGQKVLEVNAGLVQPGMNEITFDASNLKAGVYFYTVKAGEASITKKMIVE
jgi:hypothetical protein